MSDNDESDYFTKRSWLAHMPVPSPGTNFLQTYNLNKIITVVKQPKLPSWCTRYSTAVHRRTLARSVTLWPSKSPRTLLFMQRLPRSASSPPLHCWQSSICGCWPSGVELPATGGYVGTVSGNLQHLTQDVPLHGIISWHSTDLTFCVYTLSIVDLAAF